MQKQSYIWMNGALVPWDDAKVHVLSHTLHYGDGAFEGIRVYKTPEGPAVFKLREHMERLHYSGGVLDMQIPYSVEQLCAATIELLQAIGLEQGYIRPLVIHGYGVMGVNPRNSPVETIIAAWPWGAYIAVDAADIKVSKYIRIHPRSTVADAKIVGHYVNSILAVLELKGTKYHEALFLDDGGNIAEGPGENFFIVKDGSVYTPPLGTILSGITRATVMEITRDLGITLIERSITLQDAFSADEAFFTGTAAEVTPIHSIDDTVIGQGGSLGKVGAVTSRIRERYLDIVYGRCVTEFPHYRKHLTFVNSK
jgi:branched-chain amino acid aminotransferase